MMNRFYVLVVGGAVLGLLLGSTQSAYAAEPTGDVANSQKGFAWSVSESMSAPESVYYDQASQFLYVSNIAGAGDKKDGKGWISKLQPSGKIVEAKWVDGLDAPKGMRSFDGSLWVSDIDRVLEIDIKSAAIKSQVAIKGAKFLNDIAVSAKGVVYVSDTLESRIYQIEGGKATVFVEGKAFESPNGLLVAGNELLVAAWGNTKDWTTKVPGRLYAINLNSKKQRFITKKPLGNLDGLELDAQGDYLVSDWVAGKVYSVTRTSGRSKLLYQGFKGSADFGYIPGNDWLVIPRMQENIVSAFDLGSDTKARPRSKS